MVMLSDLLRYRLVAERDQPAKLVDLAVDLAASDYPLVTHLIVSGPDKQPVELPWEAVTRLDQQRRKITIANLDAGRPASEEALKRSVLLKRDVLDALLLDLDKRQAIRANDLWLREVEGRLHLMGADVSPWAVLRRLGRGLLGRGHDRHLLDWKNVEFLRGRPEAARQGQGYYRRIERLPPAEIANLLDALPYLHAAELLTLIPDPVAADTLELMLPERQLQVFEELEEDQAVRLLALMAPDLAADLIARLGPDLAKQYLERLPKERRDRLLELLRYPADTVGGIMTNDIVIAPGDLRVGEARRVLAGQLCIPDFVYYIYIVDSLETRRLQGVLTLRDLLVADEGARLDAVMNPSLVSVHPAESAKEAARRIADSNLAAIPVIDETGRLIGAVTADAAIHQLAPTSWRTQAPRIFS